MSVVASSSAIRPFSDFPAGVDLLWENSTPIVRNKQERLREEHEFVYEINWIE
jgi:hypothetical protein